MSIILSKKKQSSAPETVGVVEAPLSGVNFIDLKAQQQQIKPALEKAISQVLNHGKYILGPEVKLLEQQLAEFTGAKHAIACASGTDALHLALRAKEIGPGDVVFVPSFTFAASAEAVRLVGATPFFVDVCPDTYNMSIESLKQAIEQVKISKLHPKCIMTVDLFGSPVNYTGINKIADDNQLFVLADGAQSLGAEYHNNKVGTLANLTTTSFFPAKPLGCYGDGGCVFTDDDNLVDIIRSLQVHGKGVNKYDNVRVGLNSRLDTLQAAILLEKLKIFPAELMHRQQVAKLYNELLSEVVQTPIINNTFKSAWAQYTIVLPQDINREKLMAELKTQGVPTMVYYIKPLHKQLAYQDAPQASSMQVTENLAERVLSLPMDGYIDLGTVKKICTKLKQAMIS